MVFGAVRNYVEKSGSRSNFEGENGGGRLLGELQQYEINPVLSWAISVVKKTDGVSNGSEFEA